MKRAASGPAGFTLVELLIALSVLSVAMATLAALFSSGLRLRAESRRHLAFERDARMLVATLADDLAHLVPAAPPPMVTADSLVLWRLPDGAARPGAAGGQPELVSYQWSGSAQQDSLLVRVSAPLACAAADHDLVRREFLRWARVFDPTSLDPPALLREDAGRRFGDRATLDGLGGAWVAYPHIREFTFGLADQPDLGPGGGSRSRILISLSATRCLPPSLAPDPRARLAFMADGGALIEAAFWLPLAVQVPVLTARDLIAEATP